jgi:hypothetical protein
MSVTLSYNGFSNFAHLRVGRFEHVPDTSPERAGRGVTRHVIEGEGIIRASGPTHIEEIIAQCSGALNRPGQALSITIGGREIVNVGGDDKTGPFPTFRVVEVIGSDRIAVVQWSFEWFRTYNSSGGTTGVNKVREFVVSSRCEVDSVGLTTLTKTGFITLAKAAAYSGAAPATAPARPAWSGPNGANSGRASAQSRSDVVTDGPLNGSGATPANLMPDEYRRIVAGNLPPGFRRVRQEYAVDESRTRMSFMVVDQEFPRGLPAPCRVADVEFSFERSLPTGGGDASALGVKRFGATLVGAPRTSPRDLLAIAVRLSQNRIAWTRTTFGGVTYEPDIITRIMVAEPSVLGQNAIRLEIEATAASTINVSGGGSGATMTGTPWQAAGLLDDILKNVDLTPIAGGDTITFTFTPATQPDAYGEFGLLRVTPSYYDPELADGSLGWTTARAMSATERTDLVYEFPVANFDTVIAYTRTAHLGRDNAKNRKDGAAAGGVPNPYVKLSARERYWTETGMTLLKSQDLTAADVPFQIEKATLCCRQEIESVRMNMPGEPQWLPLPTGATMRFQDNRRGAGVSDANNNRLIPTFHVREFEVADLGSSATLHFNLAGGANTYRTAWPSGAAGTDALKLPALATRDIDSAGDPTVSGDETFAKQLGTPNTYYSA